MGIQINGQTDTIKAIDGSLTMPGTVTYEDVSRINVVGVVTAASFNSTTGNVTITENANVMFQNSARNTNRGAIQFNDSDQLRIRSGASLTETVRVSAAGSLGLTNSDPAYKISVKDTKADGTGVQLHLWNNSVDNTAGNVWTGIRFTGSTGDYETAEIKGWRVHPGTGLNSLSFNTGGVERMVMSSGGVGIGTDNPDKKLTVFTDSNAGYSTATDSTPTGQSLIKLRNKNGTDGTGVNNYAAIEYSIANGATSQGWLGYTRTGDNAGAFFMKQRNGSSSYPETIRFPSSGGVTFGGGASDARTLDDYEEGVWTPSGATGATVTVARAYYIKIGRQVTVFFSAAITSGTGSAFTVNLPFAGTTSGFTGTSQGVEAHGNAMISNGNPPTNAYNANIYCWGATASVYFSIDGSNWVQAAGNEVGSSLQFTATYVVP